MITRRYFMSAHKYHTDALGSYVFQHLVLDYKSWLPNKKKVFKSARYELLRKFELLGLAGPDIDVKLFYRL